MDNRWHFGGRYGYEFDCQIIPPVGAGLASRLEAQAASFLGELETYRRSANLQTLTHYAKDSAGNIYEYGVVMGRPYAVIRVNPSLLSSATPEEPYMGFFVFVYPGITVSDAFDYRSGWTALVKSDLFGNFRKASWAASPFSEPITTTRTSGFAHYRNGLIESTQFYPVAGSPSVTTYDLRHAAIKPLGTMLSGIFCGDVGGEFVVASASFPNPPNIETLSWLTVVPVKRCQITPAGSWVFNKAALLADSAHVRLYYYGGGGGTFCRVDRHRISDGVQLASKTYGKKTITVDHTCSVSSWAPTYSVSPVPAPSISGSSGVQTTSWAPWGSWENGFNARHEYSMAPNLAFELPVWSIAGTTEFPCTVVGSSSGWFEAREYRKEVGVEIVQSESGTTSGVRETFYGFGAAFETETVASGSFTTTVDVFGAVLTGGFSFNTHLTTTYKMQTTGEFVGGVGSTVTTNPAQWPYDHPTDPSTRQKYTVEDSGAYVDSASLVYYVLLAVDSTTESAVLVKVTMTTNQDVAFGPSAFSGAVNTPITFLAPINYDEVGADRSHNIELFDGSTWGPGDMTASAYQADFDGISLFDSGTDVFGGVAAPLGHSTITDYTGTTDFSATSELVFVRGGAVTHTLALETAATVTEINRIVHLKYRTMQGLMGLTNSDLPGTTTTTTDSVDFTPFNDLLFPVKPAVIDRSQNQDVLAYLIDGDASPLLYQAHLASSATKSVAQCKIPKAAGSTRLVTVDSDGVDWGPSSPGSTGFGYDLQRI